VMTTTGTGSSSVGERFGFEFCTGDEQDILGNDQIDTVFIATRHDSHADYVLKALRAGKHVFVEKPLCLTAEQLAEIEALYASLVTRHSSLPLLMVGYNRRFAPLARRLKEAIGAGPMAIAYRVNAGAIPGDHWIQDPEVGGGRIVGEACHFVDFLTFLTGSRPTSVHASALAGPGGLLDTVNLSLRYEDGSIGTVGYYANGGKGLPKERIEVHANGSSAVLDDFRSLTLYTGRKPQTTKLLSQDKGQKAEVQEFLSAVAIGGEFPISADELFAASRTTFAALESLRTGQVVGCG